MEVPIIFSLSRPLNSPGFPRGNNIQEMIENTWAYQAGLVALAAESYRRQRYQPVTALFQFMFVETWPPSTGGGGLSAPAKGGLLCPAARLFQPILPSIEPVTASWRQGSPATVRLWAINDTRTACGLSPDGRSGKNGRILTQGKPRGPLPPDAGQMVRGATVTPPASSP